MRKFSALLALFTLAGSLSALADGPTVGDLLKDSTPLDGDHSHLALKTPVPMNVLAALRLDDQYRANFAKGARECDTGDLICMSQQPQDPNPYLECNLSRTWTCPFSTKDQVDAGAHIQLNTVQVFDYFYVFDGVDEDGSSYEFKCSDPVHAAEPDGTPTTPVDAVNATLDSKLLNFDVAFDKPFAPVPCDLEHHWDFGGGPTAAPAPQPGPMPAAAATPPAPKKQSKFKRFLHKLF